MAPEELPLPPASLRGLVSDADSAEEYLRIGGAVASMMRQLGMLSPGATVLDVGCGCGRVAQHLLHTEIAAYLGFDRNPDLIRWASREIAARDPRFRFLFVSVISPYDEFDGHRGEVDAQSYRFPVESGGCSAVLLSSIFSHLPANECRNYLSEVARVLAPGGRALASWFVVEGGDPGAHGLAFYYPRQLLGSMLRDVGLMAESLLPISERASSGSVPQRQEFFVLEKPIPAGDG